MKTGLVIACLALACLTGCQRLLPLGPRPPVTALPPARNPAFVATAPASGPLSNVALVTDGRDALAARVALARNARRSLDVQYYIWNGDQSGSWLLAELLEAADRDVRVRLLLDDVNTAGFIDGLLFELAAGLRALAADLEEGIAWVTPRALERRNRIRHMMKELRSGGRDIFIAALDTHPNIEVRLFNPFVSRGPLDLVRNFELIGDFSRLNRRMHNKLFAADNQLAIVGGRNVADHYFDLDPHANFRDLDLLVGGPAVRDISANFDSFWNSRWAVPVQAFAWRPASRHRLAQLRREFAELATDDGMAAILPPAHAPAPTLARLAARMRPAPVEVIADTPEKFNEDGRPWVAEALGNLAARSRSEILIETAYFIPTNRTFYQVEERIGAGIRVRALTNSLASNDVLAAHAGYARHRRKLLQSGVEVHELRLHPDPPRKQPGRWLHTKAVVFDRRKSFVGTFNLDPRSAELNTEIGLVVDSPDLAREVCAFIEDGMRPEHSWHVTLCSPASSPVRCRQGQLLWLADPADPKATHLRDPQSSPLNRALATLLSWLPIDPLL